MKMRNGGAVPGARGEGARPEAASVVGDVDDDHVDDLLGKSIGRGRIRGGGVRRGAPEEYSPDSR